MNRNPLIKLTAVSIKVAPFILPIPFLHVNSESDLGDEENPVFIQGGLLDIQDCAFIPYALVISVYHITYFHLALPRVGLSGLCSQRCNVQGVLVYHLVYLQLVLQKLYSEEIVLDGRDSGLGPPRGSNVLVLQSVNHVSLLQLISPGLSLKADRLYLLFRHQVVVGVQEIVIIKVEFQAIHELGVQLLFTHLLLEESPVVFEYICNHFQIL